MVHSPRRVPFALRDRLKSELDNPRDLNKALKREHYSCPTDDDIAAKLHGARVFTVLDATSGYW